MGVFDKVNGGTKTIMDGVSTEGMEFVKLKEFIGQRVPIKGFFFTNGGKFGKSVVVVSESVLINMPNWAVSKFETVRDDEAMLQCVLSGRAALDDIAALPTKNGNDTVSFQLVEI